MKTRIEASRPKELASAILKKSQRAIFPDTPSLKEWYSNYAQRHIRRLSYDLQYLNDEFADAEGVTVLELGSVPPILTKSIQDLGFSVIGFDIDPSRFGTSILENNLKVIRGKIGDSLPFDDASFKVVIMNEVFEHLNTNLIAVIKEIMRVIEPGGKLFISTPNLKSAVGIKNFLFHSKAYSCCGELYEEYDKIEKYGHMGHVREYTPTEVIVFLSKIGFEVETLIYRGRYPKKYRFIDYLLPKYKPFFSVIAVRK